MALYKIEWSERKTTQTGKPFIKAKLSDEQGQNYDDVSIWSDFPGFDTLMTGGQVAGSVTTNDKGYKNLKNEATYQKWPAKTGGPTGIKAAQERKAEMIDKAQDKKHEAMAFMNALNNAIAFCKGTDMATLDDVFDVQDKILSRWQQYEAGSNQTKHQPF